MNSLASIFYLELNLLEKGKVPEWVEVLPAPDASGITTLGPRGNGRVRLASATEATGALSAIGRGSPDGSVSAPPGSDYRNLDGGAGATFWVKRTGTGATGWVAVT